MKTDKDIENLLMSRKKLSLSSTEKESIKSTLLEHAVQTLKHEQRPTHSLWSSWIIRGSVSFASLLVVCASTAYVAQGSLPGEPLYAVKVNIVEEMIAITKLDPSEHVAYDISLMETRLEELQKMADQIEVPASEDLLVISDQMNEHVADITNTLETTDTFDMSHEERIQALTKLGGVTKAHAEITRDEDNLSSITETTQNTHDAVSDSLNSTVRDFANERSADVNEYLSDQISVITEQISASTTDSDTRESAEQLLYNVDESLMEGDTTDALISVLEAQQTVATDLYLKDDNEVVRDVSRE